VPDRATSIKRSYTDYEYDVGSRHKNSAGIELIPSTTQSTRRTADREGRRFRNATASRQIQRIDGDRRKDGGRDDETKTLRSARISIASPRSSADVPM